MLIPGFTVEELPVKLPNVNNLRFAPDGSLTALGYNGKVWQLRDTDGDGLEDTATVWWDKAPFTVPVGMCWSTHGLFVSSSGKVSLLRDTTGDGVADTEEVVASGWPDKDVASGNVDATGVTMDAEGNLYFGLLTANYANAYRLKKVKELTAADRALLTKLGHPVPTDPEEQVSLYDPDGMRGSVQKWNARTRQLETLATGVRVPYQFAFNRAGDLFMTDQEGETWMPNGNPLDELNHIVPGRHYGFPPPHEKWLPNLISEPPVVGFGPQHQSTCGFVFNEPRAATNPLGRGSRRAPSNSGSQGATGASPHRGVALPAAPAQGLFGPDWWAGDAIVTGQSRGKLWRVRLVKTEHGYVGKEFLIARLSMLTTDVAISPKGDLYVSCHSGLPDWGTGPNGEGRIFRIRYTDREAPQPVFAWGGLDGIAFLAFDRKLDGALTNELVGLPVSHGKFQSAADRLETLKPPYQSVNSQDAQRRSEVRVQSVDLRGDGRVLALVLDQPFTSEATYALSLPVRGSTNPSVTSTVELDFKPQGVGIVNSKASRASRLPSWLANARLLQKSAWLQQPGWGKSSMPHPDRDLATGLMRPLPAFVRWSGNLDPEEGTSRKISFRTGHLPRASTIRISADYGFLFVGSSPGLSLVLHGGELADVVRGAVREEGRFVCDVATDELDPKLLYHIEWKKGALPAFAIRYDGTAQFRPLPLDVASPAAPALSDTPALANSMLAAPIPGDYETGRELFFSEKLQCATCHRIRGAGVGHGPDLSNLTSRDAASVLRDITQPSATINPDYVGYNVRLRNGDEHTGFVRHEGNDRLKVIAATGQETTVAPTAVAEMRPAGLSLMPEGLLDGLNESQVNDLLTFLLHEPPKRDKTELTLQLFNPSTSSSDGKVEALKGLLHVVLVASKQDHGPGQHDYPAWQQSWRPLLARAENVTVEDAWLWPTDEQFAGADALVFYYWNRAWDDAKYTQLDAFQARGGGIVVLHSATIENVAPEKLAERIGLAAQPGTVKYRHMPFDLKFIDREHPIMAGLPEQLYFLDEPYWPMIGDRSRIHVLANARNVDGEDRPMMWTFERGRGRVFASIAGHYTWTLDDPVFRLIILRGLDWVTGRERFASVLAR
jgi:putative heme-binding domain-containing protein